MDLEIHWIWGIWRHGQNSLWAPWSCTIGQWKQPDNGNFQISPDLIAPGTHIQVWGRLGRTCHKICDGSATSTLVLCLCVHKNMGGKLFSLDRLVDLIGFSQIYGQILYHPVRRIHALTKVWTDFIPSNVRSIMLVHSTRCLLRPRFEQTFLTS